MKQKVIIIDDHEVCVKTIEQLIQSRKDMLTRAAFTSSAQAIAAFKNKMEADIVITDLSMPGINGLRLVREIKKCIPGAKLLVFSMHEEAGIIKSIVSNDIEAYVLKTAPFSELALALDYLMQGRKYYSPMVSEILLNSANHKLETDTLIPVLTHRENQILQLIAQEKTTVEIGTTLNLSPSTIETYRQSLLFKFSAKNSVGLVKNAIHLGLV